MALMDFLGEWEETEMDVQLNNASLVDFRIFQPEKYILIRFIETFLFASLLNKVL